MTASIYERVESFLAQIDTEERGLEIKRQLLADNHVCRLELKVCEYSTFDLQELQDKVCRYVIEHKYSIMIDHIEYKEGIIMVDIFDAEGARAIFGYTEV